MSNQQDIFYVVRVGVDGSKELVQFTGDVKKLNEESDKGGKVLGKYDDKLGAFNQTLNDTKGKTDKLNKSQSSANNLLIELTRGASDAQYGIRGLGNNLEQATVIGARAYEQFGSVGGIMQGLGKSLMGPTGAVAGVTALTIAAPLAINWLKNLGGETKDFAADSEEMVSQLQTINKELAKLKGLDTGSFFSTEEDYDALRRLSVLEEDIKDQIRILEGKRQADNLTPGEFRLAGKQGRINEGRDGRIISIDLTKEDQDKLDQYKADLEGVSDEVTRLQDNIARTERLASYPEALAAEWERAKAATEEYNKTFQEEFDAFSFEVDPLGASDTSALEKQLDDDAKARAAFFTEQAQAQKKFSNYLAQMQVTVARSSGDELAAIEAERQRRMDEIRNNELITEQQRKDALVLINQDAENRITAYQERQVEHRRQNEERIYADIQALNDAYARARTSTEAEMLGALYDLQQGFFSESKSLQLLLLAGEKGLQIAQVFAEGARAAGEAQMLSAKYSAAAITPLGPNPLAIAAAANAQAQVGRIQRTTALTAAAIAAQTIGQGAGILLGGSSGSGNSSASYGYRSSSNDQPVFTTPTGSNSNTRSNSQENTGETRNTGRTKVVYLDNLGNFVARGLEEIDAAGGSNYVRGSL